MRVAITTADSSAESEADARSVAQRFGFDFLLRGHRSLARIFRETRYELLAVMGSNGLTLWHGGLRLAFHAGLAELRIKRVLAGEHDPLVALTQVTEGERVLDCTLGLGRDALVLAATGAFVDGVESRPLLAAFAEQGLLHLGGAGREAATRVRVVHDNYRRVLERAEPGSYAIVYFDPMFTEDVKQPADYELFRQLADPAPLVTEVVERARVVARRVVVIKDGPRARLLKSLGVPLQELTFGDRVRFGVVPALK
jgi:protein-L-isoaspartate O-methyltransferase